MSHIPVLLTETIDALQVAPKKLFIDCTIGAGGHTSQILAEGGTVYGIDQDEASLNYVRSHLDHSHLSLIHGNFCHLADLMSQQRVTQVDGILFDLGVASMHFDTPERGFSFNKEAPLDMRMDTSLTVTARDLVNALGRKELIKLFRLYGNEARAKQISQAILEARKNQPLETTTQLAQLISNVYGGRRGKLHPATKVFQALRIAVNDEINSLKDALPQAVELLKPAGRLAIISFHEGEDRVVKQCIREQADANCLLELTNKPIIATSAEVDANPRSRSAKLRIAEKITSNQ